MKKMLTLSLVALLTASVVLISGCGSGSQGNETVLTFWNAGIKSFDDTGTIAKDDLPLNKYIAQFEAENPGVKVELVDQPEDEIGKLMGTLQTANDGPDVIALWAGALTNDNSSTFVNLEDHMTANEIAEYNGTDFTREGFTADGKLNALPLQMTTYDILINKEVFKNAGIEVPTEIKSWDELQALAAKLQEKGVQPFYLGDSDGYTTTWVMSEFLLDELGPDGVLKVGDASFKFADTPAFTEGMTAWQQLFDKGYVNKDYASVSAWDGAMNFPTSGAAMNINGSWTLGILTDVMGENLDVMQIPALKADSAYGEYLVSQPGLNVGITKFAENTDLATKFIKGLTSPEFQLMSAEVTGDVPSNRGVDESKITDPLMKKQLDWLSTGNTGIGFDSLINQNAADDFYKLAPTVINKSKTIEEFAADIDSKK